MDILNILKNCTSILQYFVRENPKGLENPPFYKYSRYGKKFSPFRNVHTVYGARAASYAISSRDFLTGCKAAAYLQ
jgi:hypothetical protein